jgi:hypothetical protein
MIEYRRFERRYATQTLSTLFPALKGRAKVVLTLRVENLMVLLQLIRGSLSVCRKKTQTTVSEHQASDGGPVTEVYATKTLFQRLVQRR